MEFDPRRGRDLGMGRPISRRDLLDGFVAAAGLAALGSTAGCTADLGHRTRLIGTPELSVPPVRPYPPGLTGSRGSVEPALSVPHALRDARFWPQAGRPVPTGERYDLVVVGAGISGITAAYRWAKERPDARILVLDNHDDLGGHARANEFPAGNRPLIGHGGAPSLNAPSTWTKHGKALLRELGVRLRRFDRAFDQRLYPGLDMHDSVFCDAETFRRDRLVVFRPGKTTAEWIEETPMAEQAKRDLLMLFENPPDWFPGLSGVRKQARLADLTYTGFLRDVCRVHPDVLGFVRTMPSEDWAYGSDTFGAIDAWGSADGYRYPGFTGLGLDDTVPSRYNSPSVTKDWPARDPDIHHFPEGTFALVKLMVRRLIPGAVPGRDMDDVTLGRIDYGTLDRPANRVRIRLSRPVVSVRHDGSPSAASTVTVGFFDGSRVRTVSARNVILACWHTMIPYICPDLPPDQQAALRQAVKLPLVSATVRLRDWEAWRKAGIHRTRFTGAYWAGAALAHPVSLGGYACPKSPAEPILAHLTHTPAVGGMAPAQGAVAGRYQLLNTPYDHLEYTIRDQLARLLGPGGFDPARDIEAITVNRWAHGHAPEYIRPWHDFYPDGPFPADTARRPFGRIAIAGSDSVPAAFADAAVSAAYRAVAELRDND
ncbi:NAD(P)-binding protein [Rhizohabitans arisaemae]|uniref:NAD(P)-binding protein n=1 Tax=Rhizohabitans arisaemae TaxID=2720610 RepID=UPI0024B162AB|nr:NAD(P)-binding protein [Rhizohabitans arisaemae]